MWTSCEGYSLYNIETMNDKETELYRIVECVVGCCATRIEPSSVFESVGM